MDFGYYKVPRNTAIPTTTIELCRDFEITTEKLYHAILFDLQGYCWKLEQNDCDILYAYCTRPVCRCTIRTCKNTLIYRQIMSVFIHSLNKSLIWCCTRDHRYRVENGMNNHTSNEQYIEKFNVARQHARNKPVETIATWSLPFPKIISKLCWFSWLKC